MESESKVKLVRTEAQRLGSQKAGRLMAERQRNEAIAKYNANPNICLQCSKVIPYLKGKVQWVRDKKYCDHKCAATHTNRTRARKPKQPKPCTTCSTPHTNRGRFCSTLCKHEKLSLSRASSKGELFAKCSSWQSARGTIQKGARKVYFLETPNPRCWECGYTRHVEVAHKVSVSSFPDSATLTEINQIDNLVGLCPTHHWEYDHGFLQIL